MLGLFTTQKEKHMAMTDQHRALTFQEGVAFSIVGAWAIVLPLIYSLHRPTLFAWLFMAIGGYKLIEALVHQWPGRWVSALIGATYLGIGVWLVAQPNMSRLLLAIALTILFGVTALLFLIESFYYREDGCHCWIFLILASLVSIAAAALMWPGFTRNNPWVLGLIVGIQLAAYGVASLIIGHPFVHHPKPRRNR
jgi:uncharacterized membrane protein HdeD (DUF308 family)